MNKIVDIIEDLLVFKTGDPSEAFEKIQHLTFGDLELLRLMRFLSIYFSQMFDVSAYPDCRLNLTSFLLNFLKLIHPMHHEFFNTVLHSLVKKIDSVTETADQHIDNPQLAPQASDVPEFEQEQNSANQDEGLEMELAVDEPMKNGAMNDRFQIEKDDSNLNDPSANRILEIENPEVQRPSEQELRFGQGQQESENTGKELEANGKLSQPSENAPESKNPGCANVSSAHETTEPQSEQTKTPILEKHASDFADAQLSAKQRDNNKTDQNHVTEEKRRIQKETQDSNVKGQNEPIPKPERQNRKESEANIGPSSVNGSKKGSFNIETKPQKQPADEKAQPRIEKPKINKEEPKQDRPTKKPEFEPRTERPNRDQPHKHQKDVHDSKQIDNKRSNNNKPISDKPNNDLKNDKYRSYNDKPSNRRYSPERPDYSRHKDRPYENAKDNIRPFPGPPIDRLPRSRDRSPPKDYTKDAPSKTYRPSNRENSKYIKTSKDARYSRQSSSESKNFGRGSRDHGNSYKPPADKYRSKDPDISPKGYNKSHSKRRSPEYNKHN